MLWSCDLGTVALNNLRIQGFKPYIKTSQPMSLISRGALSNGANVEDINELLQSKNIIDYISVQCRPVNIRVF